MSFCNDSQQVPSVFIKPFSGLKESEVQTLFEHSCDVRDALLKREDVIFPPPIKRVGKSIYYNYQALHETMLECVQKFSCSVDHFKTMGSVLKCIHLQQVKKGRCLLHSDYVPHNFFLFEGKLVLIDPHPPENLPFSEGRLYGLPLDEVVSFIFCLLSDAGFRSSLFRLKYNIKLVSSFFCGYRKESLKPSCFLMPIVYCIRDIYRLKRVAGISTMHAVSHCVFGGLMTFYVIWRAL